MSDMNPGFSNQDPVDGRVKIASQVTRIFFISSLVLSLIAAGLIGSSSISTSDSYDYSSSSFAEEEIFDDSWVPYGFNAWSSDANIAWKWSDLSDFECNDYDCVEAQFISRDGCINGFYAAVNWFDAPADEDGSVVGYDNSSLPALFSMQIARIKFDDTTDTGQSAQMAEIDCR